MEETINCEDNYLFSVLIKSYKIFLLFNLQIKMDYENDPIIAQQAKLM